jgi:2'-hydroxyisoflavone reductase
LRLLVLGGTDFLGRHVTAAALARGFGVTLFNRGRTNPDLFPEAERLRGDRDGKLDALCGRSWDAVVDTSGYLPDHVAASARLLRGRVGHYTFISSISVYADLARPGTDETSLVHPPAAASERRVTGETYGPLKVACERAAEEELPGQVLTVRAGLLVGPHDNVPRLMYWLRRVARGGRLLAPGGPERAVQVIDARDVAEWALRMAERQGTGVYNVTGEPGGLTFGDLVGSCSIAAGTAIETVWAEDAVLQEEGVTPFDGLPYWVPAPAIGMMQVAIDRARSRDLRWRPFESTALDTWSWLREQPLEEPPLRRSLDGIEIMCGLSAEAEARILRRLASE